MLEKIKNLIKTGVLNKDYPGASFGCIDQKGIKTFSFGTKDYKEVIEEEQIYDVASLTKVIVTTTLIFKIIENKKISLSTKIADVLDGVNNKEVTIENLLLHNSGLPPGIPELYKYKDLSDVKLKAMQLLNESIKTNEIVYSDVGYILLGIIIEKVCDRSLDKLANDLIFSKLGMQKTMFNPIEREKTAPTEYESKNSKKIIQGIVHDETARVMEGISGHAGLFSTSLDISKFIYSMLFDERIMNNQSKKKILDKIISDSSGNVRTYGYEKKIIGNEIRAKSLFHTGFTGCNLIIDYNEKIGFVLLTNSIFPNREQNKISNYRERIFELIYNSY